MTLLTLLSNSPKSLSHHSYEEQEPESGIWGSMTDKYYSFSEEARINTLKLTGLVAKDLSFLSPELTQVSNDMDFPICALTIIGKYFQHIKAGVGTDLFLMHRDHAFCSHTILQDDVMIVADATKDPRFRNNPYVVAGPAIRFYAGSPLRAANGQKLGAICVIDITLKPAA